MKKIFSYPILFLTGVLSGYILIVSLGYVHSFDISWNLIKYSVTLLKEHELLYFGKLAIYTINALFLVITAIPIFLLFGFILTSFLKLQASKIIWIHSIGILSVFLYSNILYQGTPINFILDSIVIVLLNFYLLKKISKIIEVHANS